MRPGLAHELREVEDSTETAADADADTLAGNDGGLRKTDRTH
jgi:hypothetical protein